MGSCGNTGEIEVYKKSTKQQLNEIIEENNNKHVKSIDQIKEEDLINNTVKLNQNKETTITNRTDNMLESKFKNFPELEKDIYVNEGIKRMKAYKTSLKIDELNTLKDEFFSRKIKLEGPIWKQIRYACVYDPVKSKNMLSAINLFPIEGCMNLLRDINGIYYAIPNFCINDPYLEKKILDVDKNRDVFIITLKLVNVYDCKSIKFEINDDITIHDLKYVYLNETKNDNESIRIRMFFGGTELNDNDVLYQYNIKNDCTINVMIINK